MKKVYLAAPYSFKNEDGTEDFVIMQQRFEEINKCASILMKLGYYVFSPITHNHPLVLLNNLPRTYEFWLGYDKSFLDWCDELHIFMIDGWKESKGVEWEINYIKVIDKKVFYIEKEFVYEN